MAAGFLSITFIPILSKRLVDEGDDAAWAAFASVLRVVAPVMLGLTILSMIWTEPFLELAFEKLYSVLAGGDPTGLVGPDLVRLTRIVLPAQFFFMVGSLLMGVQYTKQRFLIPSLAPIVYNLSIIVGGLVGAGGDPNPAGFLWGALAGAVIGNFGLQLYGAHKAGLRWVAPKPGDTALREYGALAVPLMLGQSIAVLDEQFVRVFGQQAVGGISTLSYARALNMLPVGLVAQAAGIASYPTLARLVAENKLGEMRATLNQTLRTAVFLGGLAAAGLVVLALPVVRVAFQRGNFGPEATVTTALFLSIYALSIPFWAGHQLLGRGFYAQRRMWVPVGVGSVVTVVAVFMYRVLGESMGLNGVALASSLSIAVYSLTLGWMWLRECDDPFPVLHSVLRSLGLTVIAILVGGRMGMSFGALETMGLGSSFVAIAAVGLTTAVVYLGLAWVFKSPELLRLARSKSATSGANEGSESA